MREIPAAVQTLLKSRTMIGPNSPNHKITIGGAPGNYSDPVFTNVRVLRGTYDHDWFNGFYSGGSFAKRADGKILVTYVNGNQYVAGGKVLLSTVDSEDDIFYADNKSATNEWEFMTLAKADNRASTLKKLANGDLLLFVMDSGVYGSNSHNLKCYKSANGLGTDFTYLSTIYSFDLTAYTTGMAEHPCISPAIQLSTGRLMILYSARKHYSGSFTRQTVRISYSDDNGATWTGVEVDDGYYTHNNILGIGKCGNQLVVSLNEGFKISVNNGNTWTSLAAFVGDNADEGTHDHVCWGGDGYTYWLHSNREVNLSYGYLIYRRKDTEALPTTDQEPYNRETVWEGPINEAILGDDGQETLWITDDGHIALCGTSHYADFSISWIWGGIRDQVSLRAKRIEIQRNKGMASSATIVFDNKGGQYSPDQAEGHPWKNVMWPNATVIIEQGYGTELVTTFTGLVDDVQMSTFPHELTLTCRDGLKRALDDIITDENGLHTITYTNLAPETIFGYLAATAGFATVYVEESGITIAEKSFVNETYADAFSWLADLTGFLWYCDEQGALYFVDDTKPVTASSYTFSEGEDIVSLGYTISDKDLYSKVVVLGDGVSAEAAYISADYYKITEDKIMYIQANEAKTEADCQAIADRAEHLMRSRDRICEFAAVAVPWLQIGDCITVQESSTTISEVYRITDLSFTQSPDGGFLMQITCYHYAEVL